MESFQNLEDWLREIRVNSDTDVTIYLVGNMVDLADEEREVSTDVAQKFAEEKKLDGFIEASAKTAENVSEVFVKVAEVLYTKKQQKEATEKKKEQSSAPVLLTNHSKVEKKKGCC